MTHMFALYGVFEVVGSEDSYCGSHCVWRFIVWSLSVGL